MQGNAVKDSRWFSFFDNGLAWDRHWHSLALCHGFSFWCEGRDPWSLKPPSDNSSEDDNSVRIFAWNVTGR